MAQTGTIRVKFSTLMSAYPKHNALPSPVQAYLDSLNKGIPEGQPKNTPCCLQMSHALNATGQKISSRSYRRDNAPIAGNYYIQAVDELEHYLIGRYGRTEDIKKDTTGKTRNEAQMKQYLDGKQGVLVFRSSGAGAHTELWDGKNIIQKAGAPGGMNEQYVFSQPRILFWEVSESADPNPVPSWLPGWWNVYDGNQYYYYFSDQHGVTYTKVAPTNLSAPPQKSPLNEGTVTMTEHGLVIDWNPADGGATKETFTRVGWSSQTEMNGVSNRYAPLFAKKMT
jgi:Type VI secretion system (T6SS), amidase effector protein 4